MAAAMIAALTIYDCKSLLLPAIEFLHGKGEYHRRS